MAQREKSKYFKMNRSGNEFECGTSGFISYNYALHVVQTLSPSSGD